MLKRLSASLLALCYLPFTFVAAQDTNVSSVRYNQLGYWPKQYKTIVVPNTQERRFHLVDMTSNQRVYSAPLREAQTWPLSGESIKVADFSGFSFVGSYQLQIDGMENTPVLRIMPNLYRAALEAALKSFYLNRASVALEAQFAGRYHRPAGHPDTVVYIHGLAASDDRPIGTPLSSSKGWYDAGDFNKYIVNSANAVSLLLRAYSDYPNLFKRMSLNIPESSNHLPDILDEVKWNLDWMETMQDPTDGGVYHKLSTQKFAGAAMPHTQYQRRFFVSKSTEAALTFSAAMAIASRVYAPFDKSLGKRYEFASLRALTWAESNTGKPYIQPDDFETGTYSSTRDDFKDEWFWAYVEASQLPNKRRYLRKARLPEFVNTPKWNQVEALGLISLIEFQKTPPKTRDAARALLLAAADRYVAQQHRSAYDAPIVESDLTWGSNSEILSKALVLIHANKMAANIDYQAAAVTSFDYVFGRNPTGYSFVTGFGHKPPMYIHHRVSFADGIEAPIPGLLVGGAGASGADLKDCQRVGVSYSLEFPAKAYVDNWCSYATNEVAINWNAVLVYLLAARQAG